MPLLLIDGELEAEDDRVFLEALIEEIEHGKDDTQLQYLSLDNADHYAHIANIGPFVFYGPPVTEALIDMIDEWLNGFIPGRWPQ